MRKSKRGFASMDKDKQRIIAQKGGRAAQLSGKAHNWSSEEAKIAGHIGGTKRRGNDYYYDGRWQNLTEWSRETGIPYNKLYQRVERRHWPMDKALLVD